MASTWRTDDDTPGAAILRARQERLEWAGRAGLGPHGGAVDQPGHQQAGGDQEGGRQSHACIIPEFGVQTASSPICTSAASYALRRPYFRLMVVFTPWLVVESSNQRAVTVLVWV